MIEVTITYHARKDLTQHREIRWMPTFIQFWDTRTFYVDEADMANVVELCEKKGWELKYEAIFKTSFEQLKAQCEAAAIPERQEQL